MMNFYFHPTNPDLVWAGNTGPGYVWRNFGAGPAPNPTPVAPQPTPAQPVPTPVVPVPTPVAPCTQEVSELVFDETLSTGNWAPSFERAEVTLSTVRPRLTPRLTLTTAALACFSATLVAMATSIWFALLRSCLQSGMLFACGSEAQPLRRWISLLTRRGLEIPSRTSPL